MSRPERQQNVLDLLRELRGIDPLKQLFWSELNYQRVNQPLSRRGWTESASKALADDPVLFAGGGEELSWGMSLLFDGMGAMSSKYNETPEKASRAYDANRDGFVIAGGGGAVVLESLKLIG